MSVFYNGCSGFVNEFDDIALGIAEVIVIISVIVHGNDFAGRVIAEVVVLPSLFVMVLTVPMSSVPL